MKISCYGTGELKTKYLPSAAFLFSRRKYPKCAVVSKLTLPKNCKKNSSSWPHDEKLGSEKKKIKRRKQEEKRKTNYLVLLVDPMVNNGEEPGGPLQGVSAAWLCGNWVKEHNDIWNLKISKEIWTLKISIEIWILTISIEV